MVWSDFAYRGMIGLTACFFVSVAQAADLSVAWHSDLIHSEFHSEGAAAGDLNGDGHVDIVAGPRWYEGPDFRNMHKLIETQPVSPLAYCDYFFSYTLDANADGLIDVMSYGFPGREGKLFVNPGEAKIDDPWPVFTIAPRISNESPAFVDFIPGDCQRSSAHAIALMGTTKLARMRLSPGHGLLFQTLARRSIPLVTVWAWVM